MPANVLAKKDQHISTEWVTETATTTVTGGGFESVNISPPTGEVWVVRSAVFDIPVVDSSDSSDNHTVSTFFGTDTGEFRSAAIKIKNTADSKLLLLSRGIAAGSPVNGNFETYIQYISQGVVIGSADEIIFRYDNESSFDQTGNRDYQLLVEKYEA